MFLSKILLVTSTNTEKRYINNISTVRYFPNYNCKVFLKPSEGFDYCVDMTRRKRNESNESQYMKDISKTKMDGMGSIQP